MPENRRIVRIIGRVVLVACALVATAAGVLALTVLSRPPLTPVPSTTHASIGRKACLGCHAPVADEWRESYHFRSLSGRQWTDVRELGYLRVFNALRKPCVNCHAPANVLDLGGGPTGARSRLGVECTPNLLRNPPGLVPQIRSDDPDLGVDCTTCHVSRRGLMGPARGGGAPHDALADPRFQSAKVAATQLCRTCHGSIVAAWEQTSLNGDSCLDCHMPLVTAPSVAGGPPRARRSHRFLADKSDDMLTRAVGATLDVSADRVAMLRLENRGAGHYLPSGGNALLVSFTARDASGRAVKNQTIVFMRSEGLLLDFWPFATDTRIAYGQQASAAFALPEGHGTVEAVVRYHDWMKMTRVVTTLAHTY